jgi:ribokinase
VTTAGSVIVVGSVNVDLVLRLQRLPRPGETVSGGELSIRQGGKGANQAVAAARLGAGTWLVGAIGDDDHGREAREELESEGVDLSRLSVVEAPTGVASILVDAQGGNLIGVASGANAAVGRHEVTAAMEELAGPGDVVLANQEIPEEAVRAAAEGARAHGSRFVLNPAPARPITAELAGLCDVLTPNQHEAVGLGFASVDALLHAGAGAVVVTRGSEGADLYRRGETRLHIPAFPVEVVDTTGAGDAFNGGLAWALTEGADIEHAVVVGAAAGALATRGLGARGSMPNRDELEELLASGR